jgi:hypothetical protein
MQANNGGSEGDLIRRRHIIYVEGYDPQGAEGYHNLFSAFVPAILKNWPLEDPDRRTADRFRRFRPL